MFTLYRIDFAPARKPLRIGLCLRTVIPARFLSRSEAALRRSLKWRETNGIRCSYYSQLSPCGHPAITDTPIIRTAAKSPAKINYRRLTEINSRYYGLSLMRTLTRGPHSVRNKGSWLYTEELFVSALKAIQYSMNIALLFVFVVVCLFVCFFAVRV